MRVGIDARMLGHSGIGTYVRGLLEGLAAAPGTNEYLVFTLPDLVDRLPRAACFEVRSAAVPIYGLQEHWEWPRLLRAARCDVYHVPHYDVPLRFDRPYVVTVHDLIHLLFPESAWQAAAARLLLRNAVRRAARVVAVSECTRRDLERRLGVSERRSRVVAPGIDPRYQPIGQAEVRAFRARLGLPERYVLWVGLRRPHKNVERLVRAYARYRARATAAPDLVLWGRPDRRDAAADAAIGELGLRDAVRCIDRRVSDAEMPLLYNGAAAFVMPSLYEGFGLPPLEAAACGVPVLAARAGALPEVLGDAALFAEPHDTEALAVGLERVLEDVPLRAALRERGLERARGFPWAGTALAMRAVYAEAAS